MTWNLQTRTPGTRNQPRLGPLGDNLRRVGPARRDSDDPGPRLPPAPAGQRDSESTWGPGPAARVRVWIVTARRLVLRADSPRLGSRRGDSDMYHRPPPAGTQPLGDGVRVRDPDVPGRPGQGPAGPRGRSGAPELEWWLGLGLPSCAGGYARAGTCTAGPRSAATRVTARVTARLDTLLHSDSEERHAITPWPDFDHYHAWIEHQMLRARVGWTRGARGAATV